MQKQKMVLAFEEGISDRFEDFSTLPKDVRALYPKLNPSMIARVTWAYNEGGLGRPPPPNYSDFTRESGFPQGRTCGHHAGDSGWAIQQVQGHEPGHGQSRIDKILAEANKKEIEKYTVYKKPYLKNFTTLADNTAKTRQRNSLSESSWDCRKDDKEFAPKGRNGAFKTGHLAGTFQRTAEEKARGGSPKFWAGGTIRSSSSTPGQGSMSSGPSMMTMVQTRTASPDMLTRQYSFSPTINPRRRPKQKYDPFDLSRSIGRCMTNSPF